MTRAIPLIFTFLYFVPQFAKAGILIEPSLGYESSVFSITRISSGIDEGGKITGIRPGLRLGYKLPMLVWVAADYSLTSGASFSANLPATGDTKVKSSDLYLDVGIDLPILARIWAGYGIQNKAVYDFSPSAQTITNKSAFKLGVGFSFIPFLSVNAEYFMMTPSDIEQNGTTADLSSTFKDNKYTGVIVSVSAPFNL